MGFVILRTANPRLSFVIKKNPSTKYHIKPIRKGFGIGWFTPDKNNQEFVMRFLDCGEAVSFPRHRSDEYDYLPHMQYDSPMIMTALMREMLSTALNQGSPDDTPMECSIEQAVMKLSNRAVKMLQKLNTYVKQFTIEVTQKETAGIYNINISSASSTIENLLQYAYLLGYVFNSMIFTYIDRPTDDALDKIIRIMNNLNIPYYIRYTFKTCMIGRKEFDRVKKDLEGINPDEKIVMVSGNTQCQRFDYISKNVFDFCKSMLDANRTNIHIVDIGCGEGYYVRGLLEFLKKKKIDVVYHAHDIDEEEMNKIEKLVTSDELYSSVVVHRSIDDLTEQLRAIENDPTSAKLIVFSEVIEHIPLNSVEQFMIKILSQIDFDTMLITTPREEFNINYLLAKGEFRHPDHKQEFTKDEFVKFVDSVTKTASTKNSVQVKNIKMTFEDVGDTVNGVGMSQAIRLDKV